MLRLFARRQRASMSAYFTNSLTPPSGLGLLVSPRGGFSFGRAARGSVAPRKVACRPVAGEALSVGGSRPSTRAQRRGQRWSLPLSNRGAGMDAKTRDLALLTAMSLFCAGVAWISDYIILGSVFFVLGGVAATGLAENHWR